MHKSIYLSRLLLVFLMAGSSGAATVDDAAGESSKPARLGLLVSRLTISELGRRPPNEQRELLRVIRAALEPFFAAVVPLANVGRSRAAKVDRLAILRVRWSGDESPVPRRVEVVLEFRTLRGYRLASIEAVGEGAMPNEDVASKIADALRLDAVNLRRSKASFDFSPLARPPPPPL